MLPYLRLNSPPRAMLNRPRNRNATTASIAMMRRTKATVMDRDYKRLPCAGPARADGAPTLAALGLRPLAAGDHCLEQVLAVLVAGNDDAEDVEDDQAERQADRSLVDLADPCQASERVGDHHQAGSADDGQHAQQRDDHGAAGGIVAQRAPGAQPDGVAQIARDRARATHEILEASMLSADEAPDDAKSHQADDAGAGRDMHAPVLVAGRPGRQKRGDQAPVKDAHERVPHLDV